MSKKQYKMDEAKKIVGRLHNVIDEIRQQLRLVLGRDDLPKALRIQLTEFLLSLDHSSESIADMGTIMENWRYIGREMNGLEIPDDDYDSQAET